MGKKTFASLPRPSIVSSLRYATAEENMRDIERSVALGADGFILHMQLMKPEEKTPAKLRAIFSSTDRPIMALNYRTKEDDDDEELSDRLLEAVTLGAAAVDMRMNSFDPDSLKSIEGRTDLPFAAAKPREVSMLPDAVEKQKAFVRSVHVAGGEVLCSAHVGVMLNAKQGVAIAKEMESRGADIAKIIVAANTPEDALEVLATDIRLSRELKCAFLYQCWGEQGKLVRLVAPLFGSSIALCHSEYAECSNHEKPLIADFKKVLEGIKWRLKV